MILDIRTWKPRHLLGAWALYWAGLAATTLGPVLATVQRLARPGGKGSFSVAVGDKGLSITVLDGAHMVREASASLGVIAAWIALPPLALWLVWLATRPKQRALGGAAAPVIGEGAGSSRGGVQSLDQDQARRR